MIQKVDYSIYKARIEDAVFIAHIEKECFSSPWTENQIKDEISKNNVIFLCARSADSVLGYISGQLILGEFYISNIAVSSEYRKLGIASLLISELIAQLKKTDCIFATLEVRESNDAARKLYEKFGFADLGVRKNFYSFPKEDAHIYTLNFD